MIGDPLATMLKRSLGVPIESVRTEIVRKDDAVELERVRYRTSDEERTVVFKRVPKERSLEVQLLPFLARKSEHVPRVYARGIPPPLVPAWPWLLLEDTLDASDACDDVAGILAAKLQIERSVARDGPALRALGVPGDGRALVHGALRCELAKRTPRGIVIVDWADARLGDPGDDARSLAG